MGTLRYMRTSPCKFATFIYLMGEINFLLCLFSDKFFINIISFHSIIQNPELLLSPNFPCYIGLSENGSRSFQGKQINAENILYLDPRDKDLWQLL